MICLVLENLNIVGVFIYTDLRILVKTYKKDDGHNYMLSVSINDSDKIYREGRRVFFIQVATLYIFVETNDVMVEMLFEVERGSF